jgi:hypothetical protein
LVRFPTLIQSQQSRFYDGGDPGDPALPPTPPDSTADVIVKLERKIVVADGVAAEKFFLERRIAYRDRHCGEIIVPPSYAEFDTDLTSVPRMFTWLVPKTGEHLPAALIHDGLVGDSAAPTYTSSDGHSIGRVEADRIFRDGMADVGTSLVRRWLVWTAVTVATMVAARDTSTVAWRRQYYRWIAIASLVTIGWLGYLATADLFDRSHRWWFAYELRWMATGSFWNELISGAAGAVVIPLAVGLLWGKFRRAGWISGLGVGMLFHVSAILLVVTGAFTALEWIGDRLRHQMLMAVAGAAVTIAGVVFVLAL